MSKRTLYSFGCVEIDALDDRIILSQQDPETGEQEILVARDQLPSLIQLLQDIQAEGVTRE